MQIQVTFRSNKQHDFVMKTLATPEHLVIPQRVILGRNKFIFVFPLSCLFIDIWLYILSDLPSQRLLAKVSILKKNP